jgi:hypothetical protein
MITRTNAFLPFLWHSETAREKNVALAEAGAIVPPTFDKFGTSSLSHPAKLRTMS